MGNSETENESIFGEKLTTEAKKFLNFEKL